MLLPGLRASIFALILCLGGLSTLPGQPAADPIATLLGEGRFEEALPLVQEREREWRASVERSGDFEHRLGWAQALSLLGFVEDRLNLLDDALLHLQQARDLAVEAEAGPILIGDTLDELGRTRQRAGLYREAEESLLAAIEQRRLLPDDQREPWLSASRDHLALLYLEMARYDEAGRILHETLQASGDDPKIRAQRHGYLGKYYHATRNYAAASEQLLQALNQATRAWGPDHPTVISLTGQLGLTYLRLADGGETTAQARRLLNRAAELAARQPSSHESNLSLAIYLNNLGLLSLEEGNFKEAREVFRDALQTLAPRVEADSPVLAPFHNNLGYVCQRLGDLVGAQEAFAEATNRYRRSVGPDHLRTIEATTNLLLSHLLEEGPSETVIARVEETTRSRLAIFDRMVSYGSERQRLNFLQRDNIASLPCSLGTDPDLIANILLRTKGRLLDSLLVEQRQQGELVDRLRSRQRQLDDLLFRFGSEEPRRALQAEIETLLAELGSLPASDAAATAPPDWPAVQGTLPEKGAFIDMVRFRNYQAKPEGPLWYGASVILPNGPPRWVLLGAEEDLSAWLAVVRERLDYRATLLAGGTPGAPPALGLRPALRNLHDLFWAPIADILPPGTDSIALSPDGTLNFLSFAVLLDPDESFLAASYPNFVYTASGRDLLEQSSLPALRDGSWAILSVPEFEGAPVIPSDQAANALDAAVRQTVDGLPSLPGAREEARRIRHLLPSSAEGPNVSNALESDLRNLPGSPTVLHLSTHAFFLPAGSDQLLLETQDFDQHPEQLYRSGLVLSEARRALATRAAGTPVPHDRDGVLFSDELASLPLRHTRLVTLSSCESGLGKAVSGQGVLGLRRGFQVAGCESILLSLWPVADRSTPAFMEQFYELALATDHPGQSLWEAQRRALAETAIDQDALLEEAVLRYGCFVLSQRRSLQSPVPMPGFHKSINYAWGILVAVGVLGLLALLFFRPRPL